MKQRVLDMIASPVGFAAVLGVYLLSLLVVLMDVPHYTESWQPSGAVVCLASSIVGCFTLFLLRREVLVRHKDPQSDGSGTSDRLTKLPTARQFEQAILTTDGRVTVVLVDLDNISQINSRLGKHYGDATIKEVAWRLRQLAEQNNGIAARLAPNRFGLLLQGPQALDEVCRSLMSFCGRPISVGAQTLCPAVRLGAAVLVPEASKDGPDELLRAAGSALAATRTGSGNWMIYDASLERRLADRALLVAGLPQAIWDGALEVHLQPRVSLDEGRVLGFEALVRWCREGCYVPAHQIISVAEETGAIVELDHYMLDQAVGIMADWNRRRKTDFPVSVNLSAAHFRYDGLGFVAEALAKHEYAPELLTIEISEKVRLEQTDEMTRRLIELRTLGCRISIDDFGTGFASFSNLPELAADEIKIDPSLVADADNNTDAQLILDGVLRVARKSRAEVIVEGVERQAQADILRQMGCGMAQGFHFGRPRPAAEWLADATYGPRGAVA